jgi:hypothetical protein
MDMPPHLSALLRLIEPFHDEPTLNALYTELRDLTKMLASVPAPQPAAAAIAALPPDYVVADALREAIGAYVIKFKPGTSSGDNWAKCATPGCHNGWRRS